MTYAGGLLLNGRSDCMKVLCAKKGHCIISDIAYNNSLAHLALWSLGKNNNNNNNNNNNTDLFLLQKNALKWGCPPRTHIFVRATKQNLNNKGLLFWSVHENKDPTVYIYATTQLKCKRHKDNARLRLAKCKRSLCFQIHFGRRSGTSLRSFLTQRRHH